MQNNLERPISPAAMHLETMLPRPLSIAMVAACPFPSHQGTQVLIRHLATLLSRAGHDVHLITYGYGEYEEEFPFYLHRSSKVDAGLRSGPSLLKPAADAALALAAHRVIKLHNCDLMHVHNVEGLGVGALVKMQHPIPLVYHSHNSMGLELPTYFRAHLAQAFASIVGDVIDKTLPRAADAVITFDPDHKSLHELHGIPENRIHVIRPGLYADELRRANPVLVERVTQQLGLGPWLLYAGNPDGYQNLPLLFAALEKVRSRRPDLRLLIASHHEPSAFGPSVTEAGADAGIEFYQFTDVEELKALFAIADIGVCSRTIWTGAPIKLLNYMAVGLPVVACRTAARHIVPRGAGLLVDDNPEDFAQAVLELADSIGLKAPHRGRRCYERFEIDGHLHAYEGVYAHVLGLGGGARLDGQAPS